MKTTRSLLLLFFLLALPVLACGFGRSEPTPVPTNTPMPTSTPAPTNTPEPIPTETPDLSIGFESYLSEFQGISIGHSPDWAVMDFFVLFFASSQTFLDEFLNLSSSDDALPSFGDEAIMVLFVDDDDVVDVPDLATFWEQVFAEADLPLEENELEVVSGPTSLQIDGQEAIMGVVRGRNSENGQELTVFVAMVVNREVGRVATVMGVSSTAAADRHIPIMQAMVQTIQLQEPDESAFFFDDNGFDFGDTTATYLGDIYTGDTLLGTIANVGNAGAVEYYYYSPLADGGIDIYVSPVDVTLDVVIDVQDMTGKSILPDGAVDDAFGDEQLLNVQFPDEGYYRIVLSANSFSTGEFSITIMEAGVPISTGGHGVLLPLHGPGSELSITLSMVNNSEHEYRFAAAVTGLVKVQVDPLDFDVVLEIYDDETGTKLLEVDDSFGQETLTFVAPRLGRYMLVVKGYEGQRGTYDIAFFGSPDVLLEVVNGDVLYGWLDDSGRTEYVLDGIGGRTVTITAIPEDGFDIVIEIFDDNDLRLISVDDAASGQIETLIYTLPADGNYYITIRGFAGAAGGQFTLTVNVQQ